MKTCPRCHLPKPLDDFYKNGSDSYCKPCRTAVSREWRQANPEKFAEFKRRAKAKKPDQYRAAKRRRYHADVEHSREVQRDWRATHPEVMEQRRRARTESGYMRWRRYGLTKDQCDELLAYQDHLCAICGCPLATAIGAHLDHDHKTGRVRGFLCGACNTKLAFWERRIPEFAVYRSQPPASLIGLDLIVPAD